jgi:hypothetical protein
MAQAFSGRPKPRPDHGDSPDAIIQ